MMQAASRTRPDLAEEYLANSTLPGFARALLRVAAVLGPDRAAQALSLWVDGRVRQYKICVVLDGVVVDREIELEEGLRVYRLPISSDLLPPSLPNTLWDTARVKELLGQTLLEVDAWTHPALFAPTKPRIELKTRTALGDVIPGTFFLALSLVCNQRVSLAWSWNDHGDAAAFGTGNTGLAGSGPSGSHVRGWTYNPSTGVTSTLASALPEPNLDEVGFLRAWGLCGELQRRMYSSQRFRIAVDRWNRAATPGDLNPDRLIDLRIALEALYVDSTQGETGFRLSVTGARHLRTSLSDRKAVKKKLSDFYRLASKIIHGGTPKKEIDLVDDAATLCREGILKVIEERDHPNWMDVLLD